MIDIHSHIIPNIDDGSESWDETLDMCRMAWSDGIKTIAATPHAYNGVYGHEGQDIREEMTVLKSRLKEEGIGLDVVPGAEVHSRPDLPLLLEKNKALTLNANGHYFLLEFPHNSLPPNVKQLIFELNLKQFIPVIAHPERNKMIQEDISILEGYLDQGAYCQVTAMSITGKFGDKAHACAMKLMERDWIHAVASDTHSMKGRPPLLSEAYSKVKELKGIEKAKELFETNPRKFLNGEL